MTAEATARRRRTCPDGWGGQGQKAEKGRSRTETRTGAGAPPPPGHHCAAPHPGRPLCGAAAAPGPRGVAGSMPVGGVPGLKPGLRLGGAWRSPFCGGLTPLRRPSAQPSGARPAGLCVQGAWASSLLAGCLRGASGWTVPSRTRVHSLSIERLVSYVRTSRHQTLGRRYSLLDEVDRLASRPPVARSNRCLGVKPVRT